MYNQVIKRFFDICISLIMLVVLSPLFLIITILVQKKLGSPAIFRQERPGLHSKVFQMYKFRSMTDEKDADGSLLPDEVRLTSFGRKLRATSLDELPELWNILKGDMSFVGPRPLLVRYLPLYNETQCRRHDVRPGLTGWAQVNGRNAISWEEKFELDVWYVEHWNLWLDVKVFLKTFAKVFARQGISADDHATMSEFKGSDSREVKAEALRDNTRTEE